MEYYDVFMSIQACLPEPYVKSQGFVQLNPRQPAAVTSTSTLSLQLPNQLRIEGITPENLLFAKELVGLFL